MYAPGGGSESRDECLQQPSDKNPRVLPRYQEVEEGQDNDGVNEQADDDGHRVHGKLPPNHSHVFHLNNFPCNQEEDAQRGVPMQKQHRHGWKSGF